MATMGSLPPSSSLGGVNPFRRDGSDSRKRIPARALQNSVLKYGFGFLVCRGVHQSGVLRRANTKLSASSGDNVKSEAAKTTKPTYPVWVTSIIGMMLSIFFPFWKTKVMAFLKLEEEVEKAVENTANAVEKMAELTEKVIEDVEKELPADSKLKEALSKVEEAAKAAEKDAQIAEDLVHKVDEMKEEVETFVEPVLNQVEGAELAKKEA